VRATIGRRARRARPTPKREVRPQADRAVVAQSLQRECRRWLIMWSAWRQTYTAFACCTREPLIIDEQRIGRFLERINEAERAMLARTR
jgi:hypothetical protein